MRVCVCVYLLMLLNFVVADGGLLFLVFAFCFCCYFLLFVVGVAVAVATTALLFSPFCCCCLLCGVCLCLFVICKLQLFVIICKL